MERSHPYKAVYANSSHFLFRTSFVSSSSLIACICLPYAVQERSLVDEHPFRKVSKPTDLHSTESFTRGVVECMNQAIFGK